MTEAVTLKEYEEFTEEKRIERIRANSRLLEVYPSDCGTVFYAYRHRCGNVAYAPSRSTRSKHRRYCPVCARQDASRKAVKTFHVLYGYDWDHLWRITLTTPKHFAAPEECDTDDYEGFLVQRKKSLAKMGKKYVNNVHGSVGTIFAFHSWSSSDPCGYPHFHVHVTAICCRYENGVRERIKPYIESEQLGKMRETWREVLQYDEQVTLDYAYTKREHPGKVMHWLKYCYRYYVQDVDAYCDKNGSMEWTDERLMWLQYHNDNEWGKRITSYGCLANNQRSKYIDMDEVRRRIEGHTDITSKIYCPDCMKEIVKKPDGEVTTKDVDVSDIRDSLVQRYRVVYVRDTRKVQIARWTRYLTIPKHCMLVDEG